ALRDPTVLLYVICHFVAEFLLFLNTSNFLLMRVQLGDSVTLTCFCPEERTSVAWFKQTVGQKPQLMAKALRYVPGEFYKEYKNIKRYSLQNAEGNFNLTISNAEPSDSAVYYCAAESYNEINFGNGTFVIITGKYSNSRTVVQQPLSDTVQPGDSVTLQCTIETESCAGEHSVYWFRHGSGESLPGVIYSHGNRSDECEKSPEAGSPTQSCVYSLPKRNLSLSDAGTYYCAVAMCGEMLFGNEYIYFFLSCSIILNVAFICIRCKMTCTHCAGTLPGFMYSEKYGIRFVPILSSKTFLTSSKNKVSRRKKSNRSKRNVISKVKFITCKHDWSFDNV
uniref:Ig-like domain-containing protein n=1 Tax=Paramormyrops kingsleyae TaxID=1676925 RepID=A0A3B3SZX5_9TELE